MALTGELAKVFSSINKKMGEHTIVLGSAARCRRADRDRDRAWSPGGQGVGCPQAGHPRDRSGHPSAALHQP